MSIIHEMFLPVNGLLYVCRMTVVKITMNTNTDVLSKTPEGEKQEIDKQA